MNYKKYNDYELIYMVRENDDNYKDIIYKKYLPLLKRIAYDYYITYSQYGHDYEDFFQEALIAFERALIRYDEEKDVLFYSFAILCVKRSLITFCRNIACEKNNISNDMFVDINDYQSDTTDAVSCLIDEIELNKVCKQVIYDLPFEESAVFELKLNGFTYREIGILLDIPSSTAEFKNRKSRASLRKALRQYYCK